MAKEKTTQAIVAKELGLSQPFLSQLMSGKCRPSLVTAKDLEKRSGIECLDWLYNKPAELKKKLIKKYGVFR